MANDVAPEFEHLARPLLELIQHLSGLETTFVTEINWDSQQQAILLALNTSELNIPEGTVVPWPDTLCRLLYGSQRDHSSDVPADFPGSGVAAGLGLRTYLSLPILAGDVTLGTVCGASRRSVELLPGVVDNIRLVSEALSFQLAAHRENQVLRQRVEEAEALALVDPLTGLANRRGFTSRFEEELARSGRHDSSLALLAIDLDDFKAVNDRYGHPGGDAILTAVGEVLRRVSRTEDVAARLGGDEFALLLPYCDASGAEAVANRIAGDFRRAASALHMPCSLSIGISTSDGCPRLSLLAAADKALYGSKTRRGSGRPRATSAVSHRSSLQV